MNFFAPWIRTLVLISHPRNIAIAFITVLTLSASLLLSAGDSAAQTSTSWSYCGSEGGQCNFSGTREVRYGANGNYSYGVFTNGVSCNNGVFGDPRSSVLHRVRTGGRTSDHRWRLRLRSWSTRVYRRYDGTLIPSRRNHLEADCTSGR
jgi:hypothetical protein